MFRNASREIRDAQVMGLRDKIWKQIAYTKNNIAKELSASARMLVEPEDRYTLISGFRNTATNTAEVVEVLKAVNFQEPASTYSLQTALLFKAKIDPAQQEQVKQFLRPEDIAQFETQMRLK